MDDRHAELVGLATVDVYEHFVYVQHASALLLVSCQRSLKYKGPWQLLFESVGSCLHTVSVVKLWLYCNSSLENIIMSCKSKSMDQ